MAFLPLFRDFVVLLQASNWTSCPEQWAAGCMMGVGWAVLGRYEACQGQIDPGAEGAHPLIFRQISKISVHLNRGSIFIVGAFHPHCDWYLMPLGWVEFTVFSKPSEDQIKPRVNGEYRWGRHCLSLRESLISLPVFVLLLSAPAMCNSLPLKDIDTSAK